MTRREAGNIHIVLVPRCVTHCITLPCVNNSGNGPLTLDQNSTPKQVFFFSFFETRSHVPRLALNSLYSRV